MHRRQLSSTSNTRSYTGTELETIEEEENDALTDTSGQEISREVEQNESSLAQPIITSSHPEQPRTPTLDSMLKFHDEPSRELLNFYVFLKNNYCHENIEFWFAVRNHSKMYSRYKEIVEATSEGQPIYTNLDDLPSPISSSDDDCDDLTSRDHLQLRRMLRTNVDSLTVTKKMLKKAVVAIYEFYLRPGSVKELNIPSKTRLKVERRIFSDMRYDPKLFKETLTCIHSLMRTDMYPRFLRAIPSSSLS